MKRITLTTPNQFITVGQSFTLNLKYEGNVNSFSARNLPNGLSINTSNGQITGTPTVVGTFNSIIILKNQYEIFYRTVKFTILNLDETNRVFANIDQVNTCNGIPVKMSGFQFSTGDTVSINLNNVIGGFYTGNSANYSCGTIGNLTVKSITNLPSGLSFSVPNIAGQPKLEGNFNTHILIEDSNCINSLCERQISFTVVNTGKRFPTLYKVCGPAKIGIIGQGLFGI
jgi:hypothetical protein